MQGKKIKKDAKYYSEKICLYLNEFIDFNDDANFTRLIYLPIGTVYDKKFPLCHKISLGNSKRQFLLHLFQKIELGQHRRCRDWNYIESCRIIKAIKKEFIKDGIKKKNVGLCSHFENVIYQDDPELECEKSYDYCHIKKCGIKETDCMYCEHFDNIIENESEA